MSIDNCPAPGAPSSDGNPPTAKASWRTAFMLAFAALASSVLLTGVSVWFLGAVALAGLGPAALVFNFHFPAALVRLFALTKTLAKYGERVAGHRAALVDQITRRSRLFTAMAASPSVRSTGWQLSNEERLSDYMDDVEDADYARLRVRMPTATLIAGFATLACATLWLAPLAMLPIAGLALVTAAAIRHSLAVAAETGDAARLAHRIAACRLGSGLASIVPLQAEREWKKYLGGIFENYAGAEAATLRQRHSLAVLNAIAGAVGPMAALCVLAVAWHAGSRGGDLLVPAFIAFCWLALGESAQGVSRIVEGKARELAAQKGLAEWTGDDRHSGEALAESTQRPRELHVRVLPNRAPDGHFLGEAISLSLRSGSPTALTGPSGSGKTTLLKRIAGWVGDDDCFLTDGKALSSARRLRLTHVCLHDAAVLSDTFRENLFAPGVPDALLWEALKAVELDERVALAGGLDAWIGQDALSLGEAQRLNLARAFLTDRPIVLLDEPTEHIGAAQAARILPRLLSPLSDRIVLYATHDRAAASEGVQVAL